METLMDKKISLFRGHFSRYPNTTISNIKTVTRKGLNCVLISACSDEITLDTPLLNDKKNKDEDLLAEIVVELRKMWIQTLDLEALSWTTGPMIVWFPQQKLRLDAIEAMISRLIANVKKTGRMVLAKQDLKGMFEEMHQEADIARTSK